MDVMADVIALEGEPDYSGRANGERKSFARDIFLWGGVVCIVGLMAMFLINYGGRGSTGAIVDALALALGITLILACLLVPYFLFRSWRSWRAQQSGIEYEHRYNEMVSKQGFSEAATDIDLDSELDFDFETGHKAATSSLPVESLSFFDDDSVLFDDVVRNELKGKDEPGSAQEVVEFENTVEFEDSVAIEDSIAVNDSIEIDDSIEFVTEYVAETLEVDLTDAIADSALDEPLSQFAGDLDLQTEFINSELERGFENSPPNSDELELFKGHFNETLQELEAVPKSGDPVRDLAAPEFDLVCLRYVAAIGYKTSKRCKGVDNQFEFTIKQPNSTEPYALVRCIPERCVIEAEFLGDVNLSMLKAGATCGILFTRFPVDSLKLKPQRRGILKSSIVKS